MTSAPSLFKRLVLPGFAFKAVVIGGGYATGRELVEFFFPGGPFGGLAGLALTATLWSAVCAVTFLFAYVVRAYDYRTFFQSLLGPAWWVFELAYLALLLLILSVFGAASGEIFRQAFGLPAVLGMLALAGGITLFTTLGNAAVEQLFKYVSIFLYAVYAIVIILSFTAFGDRIVENFAANPIGPGWFEGGLAYAGYNLVGAVVILPMTRHLTSRRDAVAAGLLCGPLAAAPAILFFVCLIAFYPEIGAQSLPSDYLLRSLGIPAFHIAFNIMIFSALLESGTGLVHAINERFVTTANRKAVSHGHRTAVRLLVTIVLLTAAMVVAGRIGLITLIANGYGASAYVFLLVYVIPLLTFGLWRILRQPPQPAFGPQHPEAPVHVHSSTFTSR